jgi:hypothetical protein
MACQSPVFRVEKVTLATEFLDWKLHYDVERMPTLHFHEHDDCAEAEAGHRCAVSVE